MMPKFNLIDPRVSGLFGAYMSSETRPLAKPDPAPNPDFSDADDEAWGLSHDPMPTLGLNWRQDAPAFLALAALAQVLPEDEELSPLFAPGAITVFRVSTSGFASALEKALPWRVLRTMGGRHAQGHCHPKVLGFAPASVTSPKDRAHEKRRRETEVMGCVDAGHPVILVTTERDMPEGQLGELVDLRVNIPRISRDMVQSVLRITHPDGDHDRLLPASEDLSRLDLRSIGAAFLAGTADGVAQRLTRMVGALHSTKRLTLDDVYGQPEAVQALRRMARDLTLWRQGKLSWTTMTSSGVAFGPPGTGKTLLARALAGTAGVPLIATSYAECQRMGHQGDMLAELSARVDEAIRRAPSVFFLDELDSFTQRRTGDRTDQYLRGVVNGLLRELSRLAEAEGVIVLGATNFLDDVDPAILRSGRYDLKIPTKMPDFRGLQAQIAAHLPKGFSGADTAEMLGRRLVGCSGADVAAVLRDAAGRAREAGRPLMLADLEGAADRIAPRLDGEFDRRIAIHEAGHLIVGHVLGVAMPRRVRLSPAGGQIETELPVGYTRQTALAQLAFLLAGRAAETLALGAPSSGAGEGEDSDLAQATRLALKIERQWHLGDGGLTWHRIEGSPILLADHGLTLKIEAMLAAAEDEAAVILRRNFRALAQISRALRRERELDASRLETLLSQWLSSEFGEKSPDAEVIAFPKIG